MSEAPKIEFHNPDPAEICATLREVKTIAVVGFSPRPERPSHRIARALRAFGFRVIAVRPGISEAFGDKAYARLGDVPEQVDLVDVFRNPRDAGAIVDDCIALGIKRVWMQDGVIDHAAAQRAASAGLFTVMDRCIMRDWSQLCGGRG